MRLATLLRHNDRPVFQADRRCALAFESLAEQLSLGGLPAASETSLTLALNEILVATLRMLERQDLVLDRSRCESQRLVRDFLKALPAHLGERWTLERMAEACGLHRTRFGQYCRQYTSLNPIALLNSLRLGAARRMLTEANFESVTEVALRCGFASSQYFATRFRREVGLSPREFRAQRMARSSRAR